MKIERKSDTLGEPALHSRRSFAMPRRTFFLLALLAAFPWATRAAEKPFPVIVDTDLGTYLDDAFALALVLASPEVELRGVTTSGGDAETRAWMACRLLTAVNRREVPVAWGRLPQAEGKVEAMYQYRYHPAVIFNRTSKPAKDDAADLLHQQIQAKPGEITLLVLGPLTNVARLLEKHPESAKAIKRIVLMGGNLHSIAGGQPGEAEWNIKSDIPAAQKVFEAGIPLTVAPLDATANVKLTSAQRSKLFAAQTILTQQLQLLHQLTDEPEPVLYDAVAAALLLDEKFCQVEEMRLSVRDNGLIDQIPGKANARVATKTDAAKLLDWYVGRVSQFGEKTTPREPRNISQLVERTGLPARVHAFEDYETDIERRWWLTGRAETADVPPGSKRAIKSTLTLDFDDLQGDLKSLYGAVVFNPVPGPPMGPNTRLSFRYKLSGTSDLRVQLYSLTNGYHRCLWLTNLPQNEWREGTVDMTQMRRPEAAGGGALAVDERIDDIQFYVIPTAQVLIDDVVLYDAAPAGEKLPFPKRLVFTGWFDSGKQGKEWPGEFEIVPHEAPRTWKAAKSVLHKEFGTPQVRLSLRGERPIGAVTSLRFQYRLSGTDAMNVFLSNTRTKWNIVGSLKKLKQDTWTEETIEFINDTEGRMTAADELSFDLPKGAELWIDDVLLYEPAATVVKQTQAPVPAPKQAAKVRPSRYPLPYPPTLPGGVQSVTAETADFLKPKENLREGVAIAKTPPKVEFVYYPLQNYPGNPWSHRSDGFVLGDKYYSSSNDHLAPRGTAHLWELDARTLTFRLLCDTSKFLESVGAFPPDMDYRPGEMQSRIDLGSDGWLYYATDRGSPTITDDKHGYRGEWILRTHPQTAKTEIVVTHPIEKHTLPASVLDPVRMIYYGGSAVGKDAPNQKIQFFAFDVQRRKMLKVADDGPTRTLVFSPSTGRVFWEGKMYDPATNEITPAAVPHVRSCTRETPQGLVYGTSETKAGLWSLDVKSGEVKQLGNIGVASQEYIASIEVDPTGKFLYYVPGAHGGAAKDGTPIVQYEVATGRRKVLAFLHDTFWEKCDYALDGSFGNALDEKGERYFISWDGWRKGQPRGWESAAVTIVHIPATER